MEKVSPPLPPALIQRLVMAVMWHSIPDSQLAVAFDILVQALRHPLVAMRELAVTAIAELPYAPGKRVAALVRALQDDSARVRRRAARLLGEIGPAGLAALPYLIAALRDVDASVRRDAAGAIGRFGEHGAAAAPLLVALVADPDMRTRAVAAATLRRVGTAGVTAMQAARATAYPELRERIDEWLTRHDAASLQDTGVGRSLPTTSQQPLVQPAETRSTAVAHDPLADAASAPTLTVHPACGSAS